MIRVLLALLVLYNAGGTVQAKPKNVLFLLTDDGGFEFPFYGNNYTARATRYLSQLAAEGVVFDNAFTAVSSCSPSRSAILSGLPTHQNGMYGLAQYPGNFESYGGVQSLPNILNAHNYKTGIIGKYHVNPMSTYDFGYGMTEQYCWSKINTNCSLPYNTVARNITYMKQAARTFLRDIEPDKPFLLYVGFGDTHRCAFNSSIGSFCEFYGSGRHNQGVIPDWKPEWFTKDQVDIPPFLPDNDAVRADLAGRYTALSRMDQGVGLIMEELRLAGVLNDTLVVYFSDNGIPFPSGKTNLNEQGQGEPLVIWNPELAVSASKPSWYLRPTRTSNGVKEHPPTHTSRTLTRRSPVLATSLDFVPTILDWAGVQYPKYRLNNREVALTGQSLLPELRRVHEETHAVYAPKHYVSSSHSSPASHKAVFGSHQFHSLFLYYPMRCVRNGTFRLIHNLAHHLRYGILGDVWDTTTWQNIVKEFDSGQPTGWVYNLTDYYFRPEWQLFDVENDVLGLHNLAYNQSFSGTLAALQGSLMQWREETNDPWLVCTKEFQFCSA